MNEDTIVNDWKAREFAEKIDFEIYRSRIEWMCKYLGKDDKSIADFGCGTMILKDYLSSDVKYYPIDYIYRGDGTIICDFNKPKFPNFNSSIDCAFMSGFLEYIEEPEWLIERVSEIFSKVVISYSVLKYFPEKKYRSSRAWKSHFNTAELIALFTKYNFMVSSIEYSDNFKQLLVCFKNGKTHSVQDNFLCCGCSACVDVCPEGAISLKQDAQGRFRAFVNKDKCIKCAKCSLNCPVVNSKYLNTSAPKCYAFETNEELNFTSATAGGFQILAKHFINTGGKVVGAAWVPDEYGNYVTVKHIMVDNLNDLRFLYKSKYLQSDMTNIYHQTKQELEKGTKILFSGVSCQIAGLYSFLNKEYENLYTIDLICHHAPSQGYFKKYINEQFGENNVEEFDFRAKDNDNIYSLNYKVKLKNGKNIIKSHWDDLFCKLFHERYIMAECCENCKFAKYPKQGDITLGDFHRIEEQDSDFLDFRTEAVLVNNSKGEALLEILKRHVSQLKEKKLELLSIGNKVCENWEAHPKRDLFKSLIENNHQVSQAANIVMNNSYDIGLVGMPGNNNYGGALTYYALYNVLKDSGKSILFIQQPQDSYWKPSNEMDAFKNNPYSEYEIAKIYPNRNSMRELNESCDMFMVGSDQLFATEGLFELCNKFTSLDWVENRKKKVAYAASFGRDYISCNDYNRGLLGFYLNKFDTFTVREISGVELCKREFNLNTDAVLDPVFLCNICHYYKLINNGKYKDNKKLGLYILDNNSLTKKIIEDVKTKLNIETIKIDDAYNKSDYNNVKLNIPKVEDWLSMIQGCNFLITDSFHGMCFAIIFKKPFVALCNKGRGAARFESLLKILGLEDRLINSYDDYLSIKEIDWDNVYKVLNEWIDKSFGILQSMVGSKEPKILSDYDIYMPLISKLEHKVSVLENKINRRKQLLQKLFSVRNCNKHKVFTVLGFKIKFKWRKFK